MRKNVFNVVVFAFLAVGLFFLWQYAEKNWPKPAKKEDPSVKLAEELQRRAEEEQKRAEKREADRRALAAAGGGLAAGTEFPKLSLAEKKALAERTANAAASGGLAVGLEFPKPTPPPLRLAGLDPVVLHNAVVVGLFDTANRPTLVL
ncbi:MAG TPA: hypothetical protein VGE74_03550, partial [Gemmata sp.]